MIRKLKRQAREVRLKLAGHGPSTTARGEDKMAPLETIQELQENWRTLRPSAKVIKRQGFRYGMLTNLSDSQQIAKGYKWLCLACRDEFVEHMDAMTHPCLHEAAFREYTGRPATSTYTPGRGRKKGTKNQPKVWNHKALRKSWGMLRSTTTRHSPPNREQICLLRLPCTV